MDFVGDGVRAVEDGIRAVGDWMFTGEESGRCSVEVQDMPYYAVAVLSTITAIGLGMCVLKGKICPSRVQHKKPEVETTAKSDGESEEEMKLRVKSDELCAEYVDAKKGVGEWLPGDGGIRADVAERRVIRMALLVAEIKICVAAEQIQQSRGSVPQALADRLIEIQNSGVSKADPDQLKALPQEDRLAIGQRYVEHKMTLIAIVLTKGRRDSHTEQEHAKCEQAIVDAYRNAVESLEAAGEASTEKGRDASDIGEEEKALARINFTLIYLVKAVCLLEYYGKEPEGELKVCYDSILTGEQSLSGCTKAIS